MLKWAKPPIDRYINYVEDIDRLLELCVNGIGTISRMGPLVEVLHQPEKYDVDDPKRIAAEKQIEKAKIRAEFAQQEIDKGFPVLISHSIISMYGALEVLIYDLVIIWLTNVPDILQKDHFSKIKISLSEYEKLSKYERIEYLLGQYAKQINADMKIGVGKFESLLESIGMSGSVPDETRKYILELSQVRHLIVHRGGHVDRRFKDACPWMQTEIGKYHIVTRSDYYKYNEACAKYVFEIIDRIRIYFGHKKYSEDASKGT